MIDERGRSLLKTLVERYIADGSPVGSRVLSKYSCLHLSPATIRNVMADLEDLRLVASPHTSAGRVPTPRGYRVFVDSLLTVKPLAPDVTQFIGKSLQLDDPKRLLSKAAHLLSHLSSFVGVVTAPKQSAQFRQIEFLSLSARKVLLILVTPEGDVQNRILHTAKPYTQQELLHAANRLNQEFSGLSFDEAATRLQQELASISEDISQLMQAAIHAGLDAHSSSEPMVVAGEHKLLDFGDVAGNMDKLKQLFGLFEQRTSLLQLLDTSSKAEGVQIYIGGDSALVPMDDMSVISAPYSMNGEVVGTLGVIGPTRMAYEKLIPVVDITAKVISSALSDPK